jgi:ammonium transporter, Amt family
MMFIKYVCRIPLRMSDEMLMAGDDMVHGEAAYVLGPCEAHEHLLAGHYIKRSETGPGELSMGGVTVGHDPLAELDKNNGSPGSSHELETS